MKQRNIRAGVLVTGLLAAIAVARPQLPLAELQAAAGNITVEYERATAQAPTVQAFAAAREVPLQVLLASGTDAARGQGVAEAYAAGMRQHFSRVSVAGAGAALDPGAYVAEVELAVRQEPLEVAESAVEIRQVGTTCRSEANSVACSDSGGVPMPAGKRTRQVAGERVDVRVRVFSPAPRNAVAEDHFFIHYPEDACRDGMAAAAFVAGRIAGHAASAEPLAVRLNSSAERLHCHER